MTDWVSGFKQGVYSVVIWIERKRLFRTATILPRCCWCQACIDTVCNCGWGRAIKGAIGDRISVFVDVAPSFISQLTESILFCVFFVVIFL